MPELTITAHGQQARISTVGGRVVQYAAGSREVLAGRDGPDREYRSALLAPWPNRLTAGRWSFAGEEHLINPGEVEGTVMHGLVAYALFDVVSHSTGHVSLQHHLEPQSGYPFPLRVDAEYTLTMRGLDCVLRVTNTGNDDAPVALGVHPYLETRG